MYKYLYGKQNPSHNFILTLDYKTASVHLIRMLPRNSDSLAITKTQ